MEKERKGGGGVVKEMGEERKRERDADYNVLIYILSIFFPLYLIVFFE